MPTLAFHGVFPAISRRNLLIPRPGIFYAPRVRDVRCLFEEVFESVERQRAEMLPFERPIFRNGVSRAQISFFPYMIPRRSSNHNSSPDSGGTPGTLAMAARNFSRLQAASCWSMSWNMDSARS